MIFVSQYKVFTIGSCSQVQFIDDTCFLSWNAVYLAEKGNNLVLKFTKRSNKTNHEQVSSSKIVVFLTENCELFTLGNKNSFSSFLTSLAMNSFKDCLEVSISDFLLKLLILWVCLPYLLTYFLILFRCQRIYLLIESALFWPPNCSRLQRCNTKIIQVGHIQFSIHRH